MPAQSSFPRQFKEYYSIHETIHALLSESNGDSVDVDQVARRVREAHPDLGMGSETLLAAIEQAIKSQGAQQR